MLDEKAVELLRGLHPLELLPSHRSGLRLHDARVGSSLGAALRGLVAEL
jgi:hypothetical protein